MKTKVLVTGANGQLANTIKELFANNNDGIEFTFVSKSQLDISNKNNVEAFFKTQQFHYCINCAAYTNVDKAEEEPELAFLVNAEAVKLLAITCNKNNTTLIHISTDFVFDGKKTSPYLEEDFPKPINVYGASKLKGEKYIQAFATKYFIIRSSWLYSEHGSNFLKTMLRLAKEKEVLNVVNDQIGAPTHVGDLAKVILTIINKGFTQYGLYHFSNSGQTSWCGFSKAIFNHFNLEVKVYPISTDMYPTPAQRPKYSVLSSTKLSKALGIELTDWEERLRLFHV